MSIPTSIWLILSLLLLAFPLAAHGENATVYVGTTPIALPAPEGYFRYDGKSKKVDGMEQVLVADTNRRLASFCSEDDLAQTITDTYPRLERGFNAQTIRNLEQISFTPAQFTQLKTAYRTQMDSVRQEIADKIAEIESSASSHLSEEIQSRTDFKVGEMILLGVFDETPDSISFSALNKFRVAIADRRDPIEHVNIVAVTTLKLANRLVLLYCSSAYRDKRDIDWARANVKKWRDEVLAANRRDASSVPSTGQTSPRQSSSGGMWEGVLTKGFVGAIVGVIAVVVIALANSSRKPRR